MKSLNKYSGILLKIERVEISSTIKAQNNCFSILNIIVYDLVKVKYMCFKIGAHLDIQVGYMMLQLEVP